MTPEVVILNVSKYIGRQLLKWGYKKVTDNSNDEYTQELYEIIHAAIKEYENIFPKEETDKIPFFKSEVLLQEFLKFRFHNKELDKSVINVAIENDPRIIMPTPEELDTFYTGFMKAVQASDKLKDLDISVNYKEEIFKIRPYLLDFRNELTYTIEGMKREISSSKVSNQLINDWKRQLDEIVENLKAFKAKTAFERLETLEKAISEQHIANNLLFFKLLGLQADALGLMNGIDRSLEKDRQAKLFIRIYKLSSNNLTAKANAALAYLTLDEKVIAEKMADEILQEDEFSLGAWLTKCFVADSNFKEIINNVPVSLKKTDEFKLNFYSWLASKHYIKSIYELEEMGINIDITMPEPIIVTYKNLHYAHLTGLYLINKYFSKHSTILPVLQFPLVKGNPEFEYAYKVFEACHEKTKGSEIGENYPYIKFHYHLQRFVIKNDIKDIFEMESIFFQNNQNNDAMIVGRMMQGYNSLGKDEYYQKSLNIAETFEAVFGPEEFVNILKQGTAAITCDIERQGMYFLEYLSIHSKVDSNIFYNYISFLRNAASSLDKDTKNKISEVLKYKKFDRSIHRKIILLFCAIILKSGDQNQDQIASMIDQAHREVDLKDEHICLQIAYFYVLTGRHQAAQDFIKSYINFSVFTESYVLYCKILYQLPEADKIELLELLKNHREIFPIEFDLLKIELWLMQQQGKIKECVKLSKKGVELFPKSEFFLHWLFISLCKDAQLDEIKKFAAITETFEFRDEQVIASIATILVQAEVFPQSVNLLFKYGSTRTNTQVRQTYLMLSHAFPADTTQEFGKVKSGMFVKYECAGLVKIIEVNEQNKDRHPYKLFINKKVGETFSYVKPIDSSLEMFKVLRIMDKHLALFEQIMLDSDDPLSDMGIKKIELKGDTIEDFNKSFIEAFGMAGTLEQDHVKKQYEQYYNGVISFGEIANSVFRKELIDAYFILSTKKNKPFRAIPQVMGHSDFFDSSSFILDPTSICLYYLLEKEYEFVFTRKFKISTFMRQLVAQELEKTKRKDFGLSISITLDSVIPHVYDDQFKERRIATFEGLLSWIDKHCEIVEVPERLKIINSLDNEQQQDLFLNIYIDNRLLLDRPGHFLLTNDAFYIKHFATTLQAAINPVCYLSKYHGEKQKEYLEHLLQNNYVGISINASVLYDEYFKMLSGQNNNFLICLENLKFNWNPDTRHISETVLFLKKLFVNSVINESTRDQWTFATLQAITSGMDERLRNVLRIMIKREFRLLGLHEIKIIEILNTIIGN